MNNLSHQTLRGYEIREQIGVGGFGRVRPDATMDILDVTPADREPRCAGAIPIGGQSRARLHDHLRLLDGHVLKHEVVSLDFEERGFHVRALQDGLTRPYTTKHDGLARLA